MIGAVIRAVHSEQFELVLPPVAVAENEIRFLADVVANIQTAVHVLAVNIIDINSAGGIWHLDRFEIMDVSAGHRPDEKVAGRPCEFETAFVNERVAAVAQWDASDGGAILRMAESRAVTAAVNQRERAGLFPNSVAS